MNKKEQKGFPDFEGGELLAECNRTMPRFLASLLGALENIDHLAQTAAIRGKELPRLSAKIGLIATRYDLEDLEPSLMAFYAERLKQHRGAHS